jgi:hypothetical protein
VQSNIVAFLNMLEGLPGDTFMERMPQPAQAFMQV